MRLEYAIRRIANRFGYDIRTLAPESRAGRTRTSIWESYSLIRGLGFLPKTVIDVGVARGTKALYMTFPDAYFLLIEPLREFESDLVSILNRYSGSYVLAAAGSSSGQVTFNVHKNHLGGSSLYRESMGPEADGYETTVPMVRIDDILKDKQLGGPYLLKVDAQGAELDVLEGAQQALVEAEVVVLEVSLFEFYVGAPQFFDVVSYMHNRSFAAYDVILGGNRPLDNALAQIDIVFVKDRGMFRQDHSYCTLEQMKTIFGS